MKRLIAFILCVITVLSLFACSGTELITDETEEAKTTPVEMKKETEKKETEDETEGESKTLPPVKALPYVVVPEDNKPQRLEESIKAFEKEPIVKGQVIFYGHSLFTRWREDPTQPEKVCGKFLKDMMTTPKGNKPCINHGFGSSTLYDLCYYYERAIRPWEPKAIVICTYVNDWKFTSGDEYLLLAWLLNQIEADFPECQVFITDFPPYAKLMTNEQSYRDRWIDFNKNARVIIEKHKNVTIIECSKWEILYKDKASVGTYNNIVDDIFLSDGVHFTPRGYELITVEYKKALKDVLASYDN